MRETLIALTSMGLLVGACGQPAADTPTTQSTTDTVSTETTTSIPQPQASTTSTSTTSTTSTSVVETKGWTVADYGTNPSVVMGERGELGSGCSPGTDLLPDGIWFGWIAGTGDESISFDLACLWPGRLAPAASNDARRIRELPTSPELIWYSEDGEREPTTAPNAPGLPQTLPFWLFVNDGLVTEMSEYSEPVRWARSESAWPNLLPGCCDGGDVAPPSPSAPLPESGWPVDGFYNAWGGADDETWTSINGTYQTRIWKWISCKENPGLCPEWWTGDEVISDHDGDSLLVSLPLDAQLKVVILPIFDETAIVGDGAAFRVLLTDLDDAVEEWIEVPGDTTYWDRLREMTGDPEFPFGLVSWPDRDNEFDGPMGYRGPGGAHLTFDYAWLALEFRDGQPILYIHAGLVAG